MGRTERRQHSFSAILLSAAEVAAAHLRFVDLRLADVNFPGDSMAAKDSPAYSLTNQSCITRPDFELVSFI